MTTSADGSKVYAAVQDYGQGYGNPAVAVVSAATRQFIKWIVLPAGSNARYLVAGPTGNRIYALVSGGVVLIDTVTDSVSAYVPFPAQPLPFPNWMPGEVTDLAVSPDGATLYFTQYGPSTFRQSRPGRVLVFSAATQTFTGVVGLDSAPGNTFAVQRVAVSPNGNDVYVVTGGPPVHLDARTNPPSIRGAVTIPGPFGSDSNALVVSRDGTRLYVGAFQDGNVYVVDTATDRTTATITVQPGYDSLVQVIVGHSAGRLYVAEFYNNGAPRVAVVDTNTNLVSGWITPTGVVDIWSIALSPDDRTLYALDEVSWATNAARLDILDNIA
ncbi:hypothetical protein [Actinocrispum wychmicini]|nr:hypothetical protein [Actinocrispum wychmicini]